MIGRSPTKTARNFQPITGSLLSRQDVLMLTSQKQSKETENRDTRDRFTARRMCIDQITFFRFLSDSVGNPTHMYLSDHIL